MIADTILQINPILVDARIRTSKFLILKFLPLHTNYEKHCNLNMFRLASFLMTSQDVSLHSQLDYQREYKKGNYVDNDDDDELEPMEVDSGTTEENLLTDDDF